MPENKIEKAPEKKLEEENNKRVEKLNLDQKDINVKENEKMILGEGEIKKVEEEKNAESKEEKKGEVKDPEIKKEDNGTSYPQWYWEDANSQYFPYEKKLSQTLEAAFQEKKKLIQITIGRKSNYEVNFSTLTQKNTRTKMVRNIRRLDDVAIKKTHMWYFWKEGPKDGTLTPYTEKDSDTLERAFLSLCPTWNLALDKRAYEINFKSMLQTNIKTGVARQVRRVINEASSMTGTIMCKVCCARPQSVVFLPCGHLGCCTKCTETLKGRCPFCNVPYTSIVETYQP